MQDAGSFLQASFIIFPRMRCLRERWRPVSDVVIFSQHTTSREIERDLIQSGRLRYDHASIHSHFNQEIISRLTVRVILYTQVLIQHSTLGHYCKMLSGQEIFNLLMYIPMSISYST